MNTKRKTKNTSAHTELLYSNGFCCCTSCLLFCVFCWFTGCPVCYVCRDPKEWFQDDNSAVWIRQQRHADPTQHHLAWNENCEVPRSASMCDGRDVFAIKWKQSRTEIAALLIFAQTVICLWQRDTLKNLPADNRLSIFGVAHLRVAPCLVSLIPTKTTCRYTDTHTCPDNRVSLCCTQTHSLSAFIFAL